MTGGLKIPQGNSNVPGDDSLHKRIDQPMGDSLTTMRLVDTKMRDANFVATVPKPAHVADYRSANFGYENLLLLGTLRKGPVSKETKGIAVPAPEILHVIEICRSHFHAIKPRFSFFGSRHTFIYPQVSKETLPVVEALGNSRIENPCL